MNVYFDTNGLFQQVQTYDRDSRSFKVSPDCVYDNITDFAMNISLQTANSINKEINIQFDSDKLTNTSLFVDVDLKNELYQALQEICATQNDITVCAINDMESMVRMYTFMKSIEQGESELVTPWLIILDIPPTCIPLVRSMLTISRSVGLHILVLESSVHVNNLSQNVLSDPFCIQDSINMVNLYQDTEIAV